MRYLIQLADLLSDGCGIHGYDVEASARKRKFESIGRKAMAELASHLDLVDFDISFNRAGIACSGDLRLMGFDRHGRGIYIYMNKYICFGREPAVLYRTINDMKDFTGGMNHYFSVNEFRTPELIRGRMIRLYDKGGRNEAAKA